MAFKEIPILDLSEGRSKEIKPAFLVRLRDALLHTGSLYIQNTGIDQDLYDWVCDEGIKFFDIPENEKLAIEMKQKPSFLGYSRLWNEITAHKADWREQLDLSTPHPLPTEKDPLYHNLLAPNQWPNESRLPRFRPFFEDYMKKMSDVSTFFTSLIAESLNLPSTAFNNFFDKDQQHKLKIVKYPDKGIGAGQGVGPEAGKGARFSIPFFQGVSYDAKFESMDVPPHVRALREDILARHDGRIDDVEFTFRPGKWNHLGEATSMNRIKSHQDVGKRWYPDLLAKVREQVREAQFTATKPEEASFANANTAINNAIEA